HEYEKVGTQLKEFGFSVVKIDCSVAVDVCTAERIVAFSTFKVYRKCKDHFVAVLPKDPKVKREALLSAAKKYFDDICFGVIESSSDAPSGTGVVI
ncbi:hypothetical protein BGX29_012362, partial [Mortierella sp. GBA35]